jgi:1,6-anhydro-N-acetylmuramate kinase
MTSRSFLRLAAIFAMTLALAGCGRTESYRYKLTLSVNTPQGVRRGSSVAEVTFFTVSVPARGIMHELRGQALYLDLGPGARPLIALLTSQLHSKYGKDLRWSRDGGPSHNLLSELYGPHSADPLG